MDLRQVCQRALADSGRAPYVSQPSKETQRSEEDREDPDAMPRPKAGANDRRPRAVWKRETSDERSAWPTQA